MTHHMPTTRRPIPAPASRLLAEDRNFLLARAHAVRPPPIITASTSPTVSVSSPADGAIQADTSVPFSVKRVPWSTAKE